MTDLYNININGIICNIVVTDDANEATLAEKNGDILILLDSGKINTLDFPKCKWVIEDLSSLTDAYLDKVCRRHLKLPLHICDTARCTIREFTYEEAATLHNQLFSDIPSPSEYIQTMYHIWEFGYWLVIDKKTDTIVGKVGFGTGKESGDIHLGYNILPMFRRQGYAYEACLETIKYGFKELCLEEISIHIKADNTPSTSLAKKLGFTLYPDPSDTAYLKGHLEPPQ